MRILVLMLALFVAGPCAAAAVVKDGDTLQIGDVSYRLAGVDAPELDQPCIDDHADAWACGTDARDQLAKLVGTRDVRCDDLGEDKTYRNRRSAICTILGESLSLNQAVIGAGMAVSSDPTAKAGFKDDETVARDKRQGLWRGCFVTPADFRGKAGDAPLLGASCRSDKDRELRAALFPEELTMPSGCNIRAKQVRRARVTGHIGVYHTVQCQGYATQPMPPLVLQRGRRPGCRLPQGVQLPRAEQAQVASRNAAGPRGPNDVAK